mmetsp:Transcript_12708/g.30292  ORF Transcript_12708/g.30292 Transcript_12708/m.30292 type:complete len:553 (+) Transcript_12708:102-1760(+)|eukprot:CAMPEP_0113622160 /NCGR_PEP_ID=MMETSP0017_2-20120614/11346_1 /TAXON_ID=2856 /ORGANISM="Cylindrotheca closterium" /LENGTH=552 /DNA_ID=CAMNT_0000531965 /DNA_START=102 /DNA_END=1760 /DNA_ORIENTATION=- /assembly_acc=CAM_ASM_000147
MTLEQDAETSSIAVPGTFHIIVLVLAFVVIMVYLISAESLKSADASLYHSKSNFTSAIENMNSISGSVRGQALQSTPNLHSAAFPNKSRKKIDLNTENPLSKDVLELWHDPSKRVICLVIDGNCTCNNPFLVGRLSGPSLCMLDWKKISDSSPKHGNYNLYGVGKKSTYCGQYDRSIKSDATYYLEILTLFCEDFGRGSSMLLSSPLPPEHNEAWLNFNFSTECMQNPATNRLTRINSTINTISTAISDDVPSISQFGHWLWNATTLERQLPTRYQPQGCRGSSVSACTIPTDDSGFGHYAFWWNPALVLAWQKQEFPRNFESRNPEPSPFCPLTCADSKCRKLCVKKSQNSYLAQKVRFKVCLIGASHSVHLAYSLHKLNLGRWFFHVQEAYPKGINEEFFLRKHKELGCGIFVIGIGQWPSSWAMGTPFLFEQYKSEMARIVNTVASMPPQIGNTTFQVYFRSMHHMPVGDVTGTCPPQDWRSPPVVESYNYLLKQAVQAVEPCTETNIAYLDTSFITQSMWDVAYDFCHLPRRVADIEAHYIAATTLLR